MLPAAALVLAGLYLSTLMLLVSRSLALRDIAGACVAIVLPAVTVAVLACELQQTAGRLRQGDGAPSASWPVQAAQALN